MKPFLEKFDGAAYRERAIGESVAPELVSLMLPLSQGRIFFLAGAGISVSQPTGLPTGKQLAELLAQWLRDQNLGSVVDDLGDATDLGEVCEAIEEHTNRDTLNYQLFHSADWKHAHPNLCHFMLALLFGEGLIRRSFTFNWDDKVRQAADVVDALLSCAVDGPTLRSGSDPKFVHLHGHVEHPETLIATTGDLSRSPLWAEPSLESEIHEQEIVLVGFAAEPAYLIEGLKRFKELVNKPPFAVLSRSTLDDFKSSSPQLSELCGFDDGSGASHFIQSDACEALTELVRAHYGAEARRLLNLAGDRAAELASTWGCPSVESLQTLETGVLGQCLFEFLAFAWRGQALGETEAFETRLVPMSRYADQWASILTTVLVLANCIDVASLDMIQDGFRLTLNSGDRVDLWPLLAREGRPLLSATSNAQKHAGLFSRPRDAAIPLVVVAEGGWGMPRVGHASIVGTDSPGSVLNPGRGVVDAVSISILQTRLAQLDDAPELGELVTLGAHDE